MLHESAATHPAPLPGRATAHDGLVMDPRPALPDGRLGAAARTPSWKVVLLALVTAGLATGIVARLTPLFEPDATCCDHLFYRSMAYNLVGVTRPDLNVPPPGNRLPEVYRHPYWGRFMYEENGLNRQPPYAYRVLTPVLARLVAEAAYRGDINAGFSAVSFISLVLAGTFMALALWQVTGSAETAVVGAAVFASLYFAVGFNLFDYMLTDSLALGFVALAVFLLVSRRRLPFFLVCWVGVFNKETMLAVVPCYLLLELSERRPRLSTLGMTLLVFGSYAALRLLVPIPRDTYTFETTFVGLQVLPTLGETYLQVFGLLGITAASRVWLSPYGLVLAPIVGGAVAGCLFSGDHARTLVYAFPVVLIAALTVSVGSRAGRLLVVGPVVAYFVVLALEHRLGADARVAKDVSLGAGLVLEVVFWAYYLRRAEPLVRASGP